MEGRERKERRGEELVGGTARGLALPLQAPPLGGAILARGQAGRARRETQAGSALRPVGLVARAVVHSPKPAWSLIAAWLARRRHTYASSATEGL